MKFIRKHLYLISVIVLLLVLLGYYLIKRNLYSSNDVIIDNQDENLSYDYDKDDLREEEKICIVDVKGAVKKPGVYQISCQKTVNDAINEAGGVNDVGDTSVINLAKKIIDEMVVIVYTHEEVENSNVPNTVIKEIEGKCNCPSIKNDGCINDSVDKNIIDNDGNLININTATVEELQKISGIGESKAKAIYEYRIEHGNFEKIEDLLNVSGIGENLWEQIKDKITV